MLTGFITDANGSLMAEGDTPGETSLEPGLMMRLSPGESVTFSNPPAIGVEMADFNAP